MSLGTMRVFACIATDNQLSTLAFLTLPLVCYTWVRWVVQMTASVSTVTKYGWFQLRKTKVSHISLQSMYQLHHFRTNTDSPGMVVLLLHKWISNWWHQSKCHQEQKKLYDQCTLHVIPCTQVFLVVLHAHLLVLTPSWLCFHPE